MISEYEGNGDSENVTRVKAENALLPVYRKELRKVFLGPVHTKTIVNANASKRKLFYAFRPSVHTKTMKTLTVNA